jgi:uncharacterized protein YcbX
MAGRISWIALTPVKATALEHVDEIDVTEQGLDGDRRFFLVDDSNRLVNDLGKRRGRLQTVHAAYDDEARALTLRLPDGSTAAGGTEPGDELTARFHGISLKARRTPGPWDEALSELIEEPVRLVTPHNGGVDRRRSGAVTLLGEASLGAMAGALEVPSVDGRRFRMNLGVEGLEPHEEDSWVGRRLRVGEAVVVPQGNVGRCAITTQNPDTGLPDLNTLGALARYRAAVPTSEPLPFGVHAAVAVPGRIRVGDPVEPLS